MSRAATSLFVFGVYLAFLSVILLLAPNLLLGLFGLGATSEVWIRVVGMLLFFLTLYYIQAARGELTLILQWSVYIRVSVIVFFIVFVVAGLAPTALILFGIVDLLAAIWTAVALRQDAQQPKSLRTR